jgi:threonine/homoserine/homoserine lactone efflux protein
MVGNLLVLWLAAFPLMGSPGPATMSLAAIGAAYGARAGWPYLLGIWAGTIGVVVLIATGVTGLLLAVPALGTVIVFAAAAYILYLAWRIATAPPLAADAGATRAPSLAGGFALAIANPKAYAAIGAVYTGSSVVPGDLAADTAIKIAALALVVVIVNSAWLVFGSLISGLLRDPAASRVANVIFAVLLVASVALALIW